MGQKVVFWVKKRCFGVLWTRCEVADLKQTQTLTTMDHRNKIQMLALPTDDPGDTPDCITEYGLCACEYGCMCHTALTAEKYGWVSLEPTLHLALLVQPETPKKVCQPENTTSNAKTAKITPVGPKKGRKFSKKYLLRKFAIFQSLMRGTAKWHGFLHIVAHLVAEGVLGHMWQIHPISTCTQGKSANFSEVWVSPRTSVELCVNGP